MILFSLCTSSTGLRTLLIIKIVLQIICTIIPLIIIYRAFSTSLKNTVDGGKDIKNDLPVLFKNLVAGLIIFLIPTIINFTFTNLLNDKSNFINCINNASLEGVLTAEAKEKQEAEDKKKQEEQKAQNISKEMQDKRKAQINDAAKKREEQNKNKTDSTRPSGNGSFNLEHAINVTSDPHSSEHENLPWHGGTVGSHAGMIGAYVEAINILNGTDYTLKEIYNKIISAHPEQKEKNVPVYENTDINDYYNIVVTRAPANMTEIKNAISQGKLVAEIVDTDKWRDENGNFFGKDGRHTGLIFYFDGTHYHMKTSVKKNAIYTEEQLKEWLGNTSTELIIYSKK